MFNPNTKKTIDKVHFDTSDLTAKTLFSPALSLSQKLKQLGNTDTPLTIVLRGYNIADGIGDFRNLIDYYLWCQEIFQHCPWVTLKAIAFVSQEKAALAKKLKPATLKDYYVVNIHEALPQNHLALAEQAEIMLITGWDPHRLGESFQQINQKVVQDPYLQALLDQCDCLLNIATPFENSDNLLLHQLNPACLIYSLLEYAPTQAGDVTQKNYHEYTEHAMGIRSSDVGLKFNEVLWDKVTKLLSAPDEAKAQALLSLTNRDLLTTLLSGSAITKEAVTAYLAEVKLGSGYLQSPLATERFIRLACQLVGDNRSVDLIIALSHCKDAPNPALEKQLVSLGFTTLIKINHQGEEKETINMTRQWGTPKRVLRLIDFTGCGSEDAEVFSELSFIVGGSGDNSFSDVIATRAFPFFSLPPWKRQFMNSFITYCKEQISGQYPRELVEYLSLLNFFERGIEQNTPEKLEKLAAFAVKHFSAIQAQWNQVCNKIHKTKNAKFYFYEIIGDCLIGAFMKKLGPTFLNQVWPIIEAEGIEPQSLLRLAIQVDAPSIIEKLVSHREEQGASMVDQLSTRWHNKRGTTPLALSVLLNREPLVRRLLELKADPNRNPSGDSLLELAFIKKVNPSLIALLFENGYRINLLKPEGFSLISKFIQENPTLTKKICCYQPLIQENADFLLYHAIRMNDKILISEAIQSGAILKATLAYEGLLHFAQFLYEEPGWISKIGKSKQHCMTLLLYAAVKNKNPERARLAIEAGAKLSLDEKLFHSLIPDKNTLFHEIVLNQDIAMMRTLLETLKPEDSASALLLKNSKEELNLIR